MVAPDTPISGYYRAKLTRGGVWVPIKIFRRASQPDRSEMWIAIRDGEFVDVFDVWPGCSGQRITEAEFDYLIALRQHQKIYGVSEGLDDARKPVDWLTTKTVF